MSIVFRAPDKKREAEEVIRGRVAVLGDLDSDERERTIRRCMVAVGNGQRADAVNVDTIANDVRSKRSLGNPARPTRNTFPKARW